MLGQGGHAQLMVGRLRQSHEDLVLVHGDVRIGLEFVIEHRRHRRRCGEKGPPCPHLHDIEWAGELSGFNVRNGCSSRSSRNSLPACRRRLLPAAAGHRGLRVGGLLPAPARACCSRWGN